MNAHPKIKIAASNGSSVTARPVPAALDGILDELASSRMIAVTCTEDGNFIIVDAESGYSASFGTLAEAEAEVRRLKMARAA